MAGLATAYGSGAMTNSIGEIEFADTILVTGSNTTEMHPIISSKVKRAVREHGARLIVVDPRNIQLVFYSEKWLRPFPGTDVAWINGLMNVIINEGIHDKTFVEERTEGFDALKKAISNYTPKKVEKISGIPAKDLIEAARLMDPLHLLRSCMLWGSPSTQPARTTSSPWPIWPCCAGRLAGRVRVSIRCVGKTTFRGPATWAASPMYIPDISR